MDKRKYKALMKLIAGPDLAEIVKQMWADDDALFVQLFQAMESIIEDVSAEAN